MLERGIACIRTTACIDEINVGKVTYLFIYSIWILKGFVSVMGKLIQLVLLIVWTAQCTPAPPPVLQVHFSKSFWDVLPAYWGRDIRDEIYSNTLQKCNSSPLDSKSLVCVFSVLTSFQLLAKVMKSRLGEDVGWLNELDNSQGILWQNVVFYINVARFS